MKKIYYIVAFIFLAASCGNGLDLPSIGVETDLNKIPLPQDLDDLMEVQLKDASVAMVHSGGLHTADDFDRIKQNLALSPWKEGYARLTANAHAQTSWVPQPQTTITRGSGTPENYAKAFNDVAAAYQLALRWKITDDVQYAEKAIEILNGWAAICGEINGTTDSSLAAGIYGYQFAAAAELLRDYAGWAEDDFKAYQKWMLDVFYPMNKDFLVRHHDTPAGHYWANWALCNIASTMAIGILTDRRDLYNEGIEHLQKGETNGRFSITVYHVFGGENSTLAQWQESNRDQGHTYLCQGLLGMICQLAWNQGDDFFAYGDNMFLKACEYTSKYNYASLDVPNVPYTREYKGAHGTAYEEYPVISERNAIDRPVWALAYYHYAKIKGLDASKYLYTEMGMNRCFPEGGGGDYGANSGGYDTPGLGTLMYAR